MAKQDIPLIGPILNRILGSRNDRFVKKYLARAAAINALEPKTRLLTDTQIRAQIGLLRGRIDKGELASDLMTDAFAVAREGMDRGVGIRQIFNPERNFDVSLLPAPMQAIYHETKAKMDATEAVAPEGEFLGCTEAVPGWQQLDIPVELYEAVRVIYPDSRPPYRARPFDVQLIGAMVLYQGRISEMKTGEGKTIVAPLATYLACIERLKVSVVTVNDYLVQRDRDWTYPYFRALGLTVGSIHPQHMQDEYTKRQMYTCDVVYGTTSEFGFDYLRDNMKSSVEQQVQRKREYAVVDEVDSILIDEARTPLIISGPAHSDKPRYELANGLARALVEKQKPWQAADDAAGTNKKLAKGLEGDIRNARDKAKIPELQRRMAEARAQLPVMEAAKKQHVQFYETHMERKSVHLTHDGIAEAQRLANVGSFYVGENMDLPHLLEQALRANVAYQRDRDYIVVPQENPQTGRTEPSVVIVDISTGRPMVGRQWSDGLHQACETKEGVPIKQETQTVASVTIQNFFKMYKRLAGMTGTADTEAQEFHDIYKLDVVTIPTNRQVTRRDFDDMVFLSAKDKWEFIVDEIKAFHDVGRPVLVGTTSVEKSETLATMLDRKYQIKHEVLNAKQHEREANIVENAGQLGAVMIATNMAGRGTDIKLGKVTREQLLDHWLRREIAGRSVSVSDSDEQLREKVYRKVASGIKELGLSKKDAEVMPFAELELKLLGEWAMRHTFLTEKEVARLDAGGLRNALDRNGRFLLHRIRWFETMEDMGGLHVVGTERHDSRRIDNQLRGRSGRQGDKGSSRFFISLEDDLMKLFAGDGVLRLLSTMGMKEGDAIEHPMLSKSVERAQRKVEEINFQRRKQILEYDEVMEHQRKAFYTLRQRVLEGRDMKGLIFDYIRDSTRDACHMFLSPNYAADCASDFGIAKLNRLVPPTRLRGLDKAEMIERLREVAKEDERHDIDVHLGEFVPQVGGDIAMDFDAPGLAKWASEKYGVELNPSMLTEPSAAMRREVRDLLGDAAEARVEAVDLEDVGQFLDKSFGAVEMGAWCKKKYGFTVEAEAISKAQQDGRDEAVLKLVLDEATTVYKKREIEYPVELIVDMTKNMMRQNPGEAMSYFLNWANQRYNMGWTPETIRTKNPQVARQELVAASTSYYESNKLEGAVQAAMACKTDEQLTAHLSEKYAIELPLHMQRLNGEERTDAIRSKIESILRAELVYLERSMLLEVLDGQWKDHLHSMDQLRDGISFRAYSQKDPRIEYKSEGSRMFREMMQDVREKVTDYVFKVRLSTQPGANQGRPSGPVAALGQGQPMAQQMARPMARPASNGGLSGVGSAVAVKSGGGSGGGAAGGGTAAGGGRPGGSSTDML